MGVGENGAFRGGGGARKTGREEGRAKLSGKGRNSLALDIVSTLTG